MQSKSKAFIKPIQSNSKVYQEHIHNLSKAKLIPIQSQSKAIQIQSIPESNKIFP